MPATAETLAAATVLLWVYLKTKLSHSQQFCWNNFFDSLTGSCSGHQDEAKCEQIMISERGFVDKTANNLNICD
jgi:hypothetical protein